MPDEGGPTNSVLTGWPSPSIRRRRAAAQPGIEQGIRMHREVTSRTVRRRPPSVTAVPATPTRMPPSTDKNPCCSSHSWAYTASLHRRTKQRSNCVDVQIKVFDWGTADTPPPPRYHSPDGVDNATACPIRRRNSCTRAHSGGDKAASAAIHGAGKYDCRICMLVTPVLTSLPYVYVCHTLDRTEKTSPNGEVYISSG